MPELPEVEVICQGLQSHLLNQTISSVYCSGKDLRIPIDCVALQTELLNSAITSLRRRAKYLLLKTDNGAALIIHLGMTGNLGIFPAGTALKKHDHVCWTLGNNTELRYNDTRRFGSIRLLKPETSSSDEKAFFAAIGPEPLSRNCSTAYLMQRAVNRKQSVKSFLMDSHVLAGVGNIYANETLFKAGIHPEQPASSLSAKQWERVLTVLRKTLKHAIACGGSTISDFVNASGEGGYFQMNFKIYGKTGEPCETCGEIVQKKQVGGRASFYCRKCQPISTNTCDER